MNFEKMRSVLAKPDLSSPVLTAVLAEAKSHLSAEVSALEALEAGRGDMILAPDSERLKYKADLAAARDSVDDAAALVGAIEGRLAAAHETEAENGRRELRAKADSLTEAARKALRRYVKAAREIAEIVECVARADEAVQASNSDLPAGESPLLSPEFEQRGRLGSDERIVSDEIVTVWAYSGSGEPVPTDLVARVQSSGRGMGWIPAPEVTMGSPSIEVVLRRFRRIERIPAVSAVHLESLARSVNLPGLTHLDPVIFEPARWADGKSVLAHLEKHRSASVRREQEAEAVVQFIPVSDRVDDAPSPRYDPSIGRTVAPKRDERNTTPWREIDVHVGIVGAN
ncbi:hypothetical protein [Microvirga antarctica]|uniref:hypothetical protein n=1 Tax=Microvirga antarctica TaxID=2819233 RepID=UPI001B3174B1|nr:hypothetical protein [Microvirga antarctica]